MLRICHELVDFNNRLAADNDPARPEILNDALSRIVNIAKHDYLVVLITDYEGNNEDTHRHATRIARHNDVLATLIYDPCGISLPIDGHADVTDGTRNASLEIDASLNERFAQQFQLHSAAICNRCVRFEFRCCRSVRTKL